MPGIKSAETLGRSLKFAPGWLRGELLSALRRNGHKKLLNKLAREDPKALLEMAIKLEPKDINQQTTVNIKVVSLPAKVPPGEAIEPADYKVLDSAQPLPVAEALDG